VKEKVANASLTTITAVDATANRTSLASMILLIGESQATDNFCHGTLSIFVLVNRYF